MKNSLSNPTVRGRRPRRPLCVLHGVLILSMLFSTACMVGPKYQRPAAPASPAFKEPPPEGWKEAQPSDGAIRGKWWEIYNDPNLNALEEQVNLSNQNIVSAEAQYREAQDAVRIARSGLFPTVTGSASIVNSKTSGNLVNNNGRGAFVPGTRTDYDFPLSLSYQADLWGSIRRTVRQSAETAQASAAQLENARLTFHADLALDYFQLRGTDSDRDLLETTVKSYQEYLELTQNRQKSGIASGSDVAQAQTQLDTLAWRVLSLNTPSPSSPESPPLSCRSPAVRSNQNRQ
jgi:outer membrane protein TolC